MKMREMAFLGIMIGVICSTIPVHAQELERKNDESREKIVKLIDDLGSPDFEKREKAEFELKKLGASAFPYLQEASEDKDLERATRAKRILSAIATGSQARKAPQENPQPNVEGAIVSLAISPDSVILRVEREGVTEEYAAESVEDFKKKFPDIAERFGIGGIGGNGIVLRVMPGDDDDPEMKKEIEELLKPFRDEDSFEKEFDKKIRELWNIPDPFGDLPNKELERQIEQLMRQFAEQSARQRDQIPQLRAKRTKVAKFGVRVVPLSEALRDQLQIPEDDGGVVISEIVKDSVAEKVGLEVHDIVLKVSGEKADGIFRFSELLQKALDSGELHLEIVRQGERRTIDVKPGEHK